VSPALIIWCGAGLAGWWWLIRRTAPEQRWRVGVEDWHVGDTIICGIFAALIGFGIFLDDGKTRALTLDDLRNGAFIYFSLTLLVLGLAVGRAGSPVKIFGLRPERPLTTVALGMAGLLLTFPLVQMMQLVSAYFGAVPGDGDELVQFLMGKTTPVERLWAIGLAVVVAPITEELLFRGYIYGVVKKFGGRWAAMLTSAALFAAMHNNVPAIPALMVLAIGFTLVYEFTGSLWASIVMHMLFNLAPVVVILCFPEWIPKF
jgi:membrane protease YdiL (CAAX protease family)